MKIKSVGKMRGYSSKIVRRRPSAKELIEAYENAPVGKNNESRKEIWERQEELAKSRPSIIPIGSVINANKAAGLHWFDADTKRFFGSSWSGKAWLREYDGNYLFWSSDDNFDRSAKQYSVRVFNPVDGSVDTVGEFGKFNTRQEVESEIRRLRKSDTPLQAGDKFKVV